MVFGMQLADDVTLLLALVVSLVFGWVDYVFLCLAKPSLLLLPPISLYKRVVVFAVKLFQNG